MSRIHTACNRHKIHYPDRENTREHPEAQSVFLVPENKMKCGLTWFGKTAQNVIKRDLTRFNVPRFYGKPCDQHCEFRIMQQTVPYTSIWHVPFVEHRIDVQSLTA